MKKIFAILMAICMMASLLCVTAFAADAADELPAPTAGTVIRVKAIKGDKEVLVGDYTNFEDGWSKAVKESLPTYSKKTGYQRIIVDFYADWTSADDGNFTDDSILQGNGFGFDNDTIWIQDNAKMTINLNGYTIKRVLAKSISDGEVMYIGTDADVIINNGTITGGKSTNGAGGIHINDSDVILNNVHIVGNVADNDDGGGIALYSGSTLVMTGGSFTNNSTDGQPSDELFDCYGGAIYVDDSKATFSGVAFNNNYNSTDEDYGAAIYAEDSEVHLYDCTFDGNGVEDKSKKIYAATSIVHAEDSTVTMEKVTFTNNGSYFHDIHPDAWISLANTGLYSSVIFLDDSSLTIFGDSEFTGNATCHLISIYDDSHVYVFDTTFKDNKSFVMYSSDEHYGDSYFKNCVFNNNEVVNPSEVFDEYETLTYTFRVNGKTLSFNGCDMGNSTYYDLTNLVFKDTKNAPATPKGAGSIFGEGSLTMIFVFIAVIDSIVSIYMIVLYKKKKEASATVAAADDKE